MTASENAPSPRSPRGEGVLVECNACGCRVRLNKGDILRRHLNPRALMTWPRRERLCPGSNTTNWSDV